MFKRQTLTKNGKVKYGQQTDRISDFIISKTW